MRRWSTAALVALAVLDVVVLMLGHRAHNGALPPLQNQVPALVFATPEPGETSAPDDTGEEPVTGPVLLGANAAGDVLRATRGACQPTFDNPARVWVGNIDGGLLEEVPVPGLLETLGLMVYANGDLLVSGLGEGCKEVTFESDDVGATWTPVAQAGIWRLDKDTTANAVTAPGSNDRSVQVGCEVRQLLNLPSRKALASCTATQFLALPGLPGEDEKVLSVTDYEQLSVAPGAGVGRYFVFGATSQCDAQVGELDVTTSTVASLACLHDNTVGARAPLAIASAGGRLVVQVGDQLMVSADRGARFAAIGG